MPTHGLPPAQEGVGGNSRNLVSNTVSVADQGTNDTGFANVTQAVASAAQYGDYAVNVYQTTNGILYFNVYDIGGDAAQTSAINVDYMAVCER